MPEGNFKIMGISNCRVCASSKLLEALDLGFWPISNRYIRPGDEDGGLFPVRLVLCQNCAMTQLADLIPAQELRPRLDWVSYNEPEGHLDALVDKLLSMPGINNCSRFLGVSFKDDTTLRRIKAKGFSCVERLSPESHLGIAGKGCGVETIQKCILPQKLRKVAENTGKADMVIARHILEHTDDLRLFFEGLKELLKTGGYLVIEVPDCLKAFSRFDYTTVWEEHSLYFFPSTLRHCLEESGFSIEWFNAYPYAFEDSLVCVARFPGINKVTQEDTEFLSDIVLKFARQFPSCAQRVRFALAGYYRKKGKIAVFGAGHLAGAYINLFKLKDYIECVIDDNPDKQGFLMPGSLLPIVASGVLAEREIKTCLLAVNPMNEAKVLDKNRDFILKGGEFFSIFPASPIALKFEEERS